MPSLTPFGDDAGALNPDLVIPILVAGMVATGATVVVTNDLADPANETDVQNASPEAGETDDGSELLSNASPNASVEDAVNATRNRTGNATNASANISINASVRNGTVGNQTENVTETAENATSTNGADTNATPTVRTLEERWTRIGAFDTTNGTEILDTAVGPDGESLYVAGEIRAGPETEGYAEDTTLAALAAFATDDGSLRWSHVTGGPYRDGALLKGLDLAPSRDLVVGAGSAFKGDQDNLAEPGERNDLLVLAVNATTGEPVWNGTYRSQENDFARADDVVVTSDGGWVAATGTGERALLTSVFDAETGQHVWSDVSGRTSGYSTSIGHAIAAAPDGPTVYVTGRYLDDGSPDLGTLAYTIPDGDRLWLSKYPAAAGTTERGLDVSAGPTGERVAVTGTSDADGATVVYEATTGAEAWSAPWAGEADRRDEPAAVAFGVEGEVVYVGGDLDDGPATRNGTTIAYDAAEGSILWEAHDLDWIADLDPGPDGEALYVTGSDRGPPEPVRADVSVVAYETRTGVPLGSGTTDAPGDNWTRAGAGHLDVTPDGSRVLVVGDTVGTPYARHVLAAAFDVEVAAEGD